MPTTAAKNTAVLAGIITGLLSAASYLPPKILLPICGFIIFCKLVTVLIPPPAETSKWYNVYQLTSTIGLNVLWAVNKITSTNNHGSTAVESNKEHNHD